MSFGDMGFNGTLDDIRISDILHPDYDADELYWEKWRLAYRGGYQFINRYLQKFSLREDVENYLTRKLISYVPAFSKTAINNVRNAVFQRCRDISRLGGPDSYQKAIKGLNHGVDRLGNTMNSFIGKKILPELLAMSKVGVYVDMPQITDPSIKGKLGKYPYIYMYQVEDIRSWAFDESSNQNEFSSILLRDREFVLDENTNLPMDSKISYRHLWLDKNTQTVKVQFYDDNNKTTSDTITLDIPRIPFVMFDIGDSLMADVAQYQIALMNLASSDLSYCLLANFPFYVEQFDAVADQVFMKQEGSMGQALEIDNTLVGNPSGSSADATTSKNYEVGVGNTVGRRYPKGLEPPRFISPSSEPLKASMAKQEQMKAEIFELVNQRLSDLGASAESKQLDQTNLESGLSFIGLVLEHGERQIGEIWSMYEGAKQAPTISYPEEYSLKSDEDRRKDTEALRKNMVSVPSKTYRKALAKEIARTQLGGKISASDMQQIMKEIDSAEDVIDDPLTIQNDVKEGLVSPEYASLLRGYPQDEAQKAEEADARKLARIAMYQSKGPAGQTTGTGDLKDPGARGVDDLAPESNQGVKEKQAAQNNPAQMRQKERHRGQGRNPNKGGG